MEQNEPNCIIKKLARFIEQKNAFSDVKKTIIPLEEFTASGV